MPITLLSVIASLIALYGFCVVLINEIKLSAWATPITLLSSLMVWLSVMGMLNLLWLGGLLFFAIGTGLLVYQILKTRQKVLLPLTQPAIIFFFGGSAFLMVLFAVRQPMFYQWDEFTFWGSAAKVIFDNDALYPAVNSNMVTTAYPPALPLLVYAFQFFGVKFAEWVGYLAYDIFALACIATVCIYQKPKFYAPILLTVFCLLLPFFFEIGAAVGVASNVYLNLQADLTLGLLFGAILSVYYSSDKRISNFLPVLLMLATLSLIKDMGLALGLVAAGIIMADFLLCEKKQPFAKRAGISIGFFGVSTVVVVSGFLGWSVYVSKASGENRFDLGNAGEAKSLGMVEMLIQGCKELLGIGETSPEFAQVGNSLVQAYFTKKVCLLGSGLVVTLLIGAILLAAFWLGDKIYRQRVLLYTLLSSLGFVAFWIFHWFLYVYVFKGIESAELKDYSRYFMEYYLGWILGAVTLLILAEKAQWIDRFSVMLLGILAGTVAWRGQRVNNFMSYSNTFYQERVQVSNRAEQLNQVLSPEDRIYPIIQGNDGTRWYYYGYELKPTLLKMYGGGDASKQNPYLPTTAATLTNTEGLGSQQYEVVTNVQNLLGYLRKTQATVLLVDRADDYTAKMLQPYTNGTIDNSGLTKIAVYSIDWKGDTPSFTPISLEVSP